MIADGVMSHGKFVRDGKTLAAAGAEEAAAPPNRTDQTARLRARNCVATGALGLLDAYLDGFGRDVLEALSRLGPRRAQPLGLGPRGGALQYVSRSDMQLACYAGEGSY